ncbi:MAG: hypothetical protein MZU79_06890 [Anaerotruncus sp.]|nr:hypothetical protein [Anaerotruncus sp.]
MDDAEVLQAEIGRCMSSTPEMPAILVHLLRVIMGDAFLNKLNGCFGGLLIDYLKKRDPPVQRPIWIGPDLLL